MVVQLLHDFEDQTQDANISALSPEHSNVETVVLNLQTYMQSFRNLSKHAVIRITP